MSTRCGKRIHHNSFLEITMKSEADCTRSERKTRSKHTKENIDKLDLKIAKRNYVTYPASEEAGGVDTVDNRVEEKKSRALRKNALRERNKPASTESVDLEGAVESRKSMRSTRKTRKYDENSQDDPEVIPQCEEPSKTEVPKPKKGKKQKLEKKLEEVKVPKKKSKKKKGRKSGSIIVEDVDLEAPSVLNKSNMSVDSFHSAAGSPRHPVNCDDLVPFTQNDKEQDTIKYSTPVSNGNKDEARKTRSSAKVVNTLTKESVTVKEPKKRKSNIKLIHDNNLKDVAIEKEEHNLNNTSSKESLKSKHSIKDVTLSEDTKNATFGMEKPDTSTRKSVRNATLERTGTPTKTNKTLLIDDSKITPKPKNKREKKERDIEIAMLNVNEDLKSPAEGNLMLENDSILESGNDSSKNMKSSAHKLRKLAINSSAKSASKYKKKSVNETIETEDIVIKKMSQIIYPKLNLTDKSPFKLSPMPLPSKDDNIKSVMDATFEKDSDSTQGKKNSIVDMTFELTSSPLITTNELCSPLLMTHENDMKHKSVMNTTYEKDSDTNKEKEEKSSENVTFDKDVTQTKINTFERDSKNNIDTKQQRKSLLTTQKTADTEINRTFDIDQKKLDSTFDKNSKSSLISSEDSMITLDKSDASRISITSDESKNEENILNTTPVLIESSMEVSTINATITPTKESTLTPECLSLPPVTPLKREGTFTKDEPQVIGSPKRNSLQTPTKRMSLPSPGFTPFHVKSSKEKNVLLNVTRSIEKRRSSMAELPRATKVMFCSPVNNSAVVAQNRRKVIKSNLKGSNKSFVFDESVSVEMESRPGRKRSYTQSDADETRVKRTRLAGDQQQSVERLSRPRPRTSSASAKLTEPTTPSKRSMTPSKKSDAKQTRTKLPNFAALHQKQFDKMESLDECQERKARRAKQLLTPTGAVNVLDRISPKDKATESEKPKETLVISKEAPKKPDTPIKSLPTLKSLNPGYTRFGFKLNLDVNPFSIPSKTLPKPKENKPNGLNRQPTPSLAGATSLRRKVAKQTAMREILLSSGKRNVDRIENRTVIKGVRTNRRFELQMRMRDI